MRARVRRAWLIVDQRHFAEHLSSSHVAQWAIVNVNTHLPFGHNIEDQTGLRAKGIRHAGTGFIESTLFRGGSLLKNMDVAENQVTELIDSLRKDEYALIQQALSAEDKATAPG